MRIVRLASCAALALALPTGPAVAQDSLTIVGELRAEAKAVAPLFKSKLVASFLAGVPALPEVSARTVLRDSAATRYYTEREAEALPDTMRARLVRRLIASSFYYTTRYGSPLAYARALEILSRNGFADANGKRIADFGYGTIGHLRLLAALGADVHGIEVDALLRTLYSWPGDQGEIAGANGRRGTLALHHGRWPAEAPLVTEVGGGYDLFLSKNTLKNGYLHPAQPVNPRMLVRLGVGDTAYVHALAQTVKRGGIVMIYNLCPAPAPPDKPYIPWADGRCPFPKELWKAEGFEVVAFDQDDSPAARAMGHALGWDQGESPMDLEHDLFATYTIVRRK